MFKREPRIEDLKLANEIDSVMNRMAEIGPDDPEYPKQIVYLQRLNDLKTQKRDKRVSPDTMAIVLGNLIGILIIVAYEQKHIMKSTSMNFIMKPKTNITN